MPTAVGVVTRRKVDLGRLNGYGMRRRVPGELLMENKEPLMS